MIKVRRDKVLVYRFTQRGFEFGDHFDTSKFYLKEIFDHVLYFWNLPDMYMSSLGGFERGPVKYHKVKMYSRKVKPLLLQSHGLGIVYKAWKALPLMADVGQL